MPIIAKLLNEIIELKPNALQGQLY